MNDNLPDGWVWTTIGDIVTFEYGKGLTAAKRNDNGKIPVYGSNGIVGYHSTPLINKPCLIIGRKGAAGAVHKSEIPCWPIDTTYYVIPPDNINLSFLYHLFSNLEFVSLDRSTAIPGLNRNDAYALNIPLPPLPEQERIVAKIEELFTQLDAATAALKRIQATLKRYKASVLKAACEGRLFEDVELEESALPKGWVWTTVGDLSQKIQYGTSEKANLDSSGIPVLRMGNIQDGHLDFKNLKYLSENTPGVENLILGNGDLIFNRTNSAELVGKTAVYKSFHPRATFASYLIRVKFSGACLPDYISFYINSLYGRKYIASVVSQQVGQANVNGTKLANMPIPIPPLEEQRRIVAEVERRLSLAQEVEAVVAASLARASRLRQAVLKTAFDGRLVG